MAQHIEEFGHQFTNVGVVLNEQDADALDGLSMWQRHDTSLSRLRRFRQGRKLLRPGAIATLATRTYVKKPARRLNNAGIPSCPRACQKPSPLPNPCRSGRGWPWSASAPSAGGLEAAIQLFAAWPADGELAFILVQHLDPSSASMMADLMVPHTGLVVCEATEAAPVLPGHLYVIPPGPYLSVEGGLLRLSTPAARPGARLPFDFLLHSLAPPVWDPGSLRYPVRNGNGWHCRLALDQGSRWPGGRAGPGRGGL